MTPGDLNAALNRSNIRVYWCLGAVFVCFGVGSVILLICFIRRCRLKQIIALRKENQGHGIRTAAETSVLQEESFRRIGPSSGVKNPDPRKPKSVAGGPSLRKPRLMSPVTFKSTIPTNVIVPTTDSPAPKSPGVERSVGEIPTGPDETGCRRDDNLNIIDGPQTEESGRLRFTVGYDRQNLALSVTIVGASGLPAPSLCGGSGPPTATNQLLTDPYVKLQLLPDRQFKAKTRIAKKTAEPVYDETFTFYGFNYAAVKGTSLHMSVLGFDRFSRDDVVGDVIFHLCQLDLDDGKTMTFTRALNRRHRVRTGQIESRGELLVSVCHQPLKENLIVTVLKGRNLPKVNIAGLTDPYVKVYMSYRGQRIAKKRSRVAKCTQDPVYNESFVFRLVREQVLRDTEVEFCVLDWDGITKNEVLGRLRLSLDHRGSGVVERKHWAEMVRNPEKQLAMWHRLKA